MIDISKIEEGAVLVQKCDESTHYLLVTKIYMKNIVPHYEGFRFMDMYGEWHTFEEDDNIECLEHCDFASKQVSDIVRDMFAYREAFSAKLKAWRIELQSLRKAK